MAETSSTSGGFLPLGPGRQVGRCYNRPDPECRTRHRLCKGESVRRVFWGCVGVLAGTIALSAAGYLRPASQDTGPSGPKHFGR